MNKILSVGVAVAIILSIVGVVKTKTVTIDKNIDPKELAGVMSYLPTPEINLGGMRLVGKQVALATGTSTVCAIQSPTATSTLLNAGIKFTLASTSAVVVDLAKGTTRFATSTRIGSAYGIAASAQATIVASSTGSVAGDGTIFAPSEWFVVKYSDNNSGTGNVSTGSCSALFIVK